MEPKTEAGGGRAAADQVVLLVARDKSSDMRDNEMSLFELFSAIWTRKWLVAAALSLCLAIAGSYAYLAPQWFESEVTLVQARQSTGGLSSSLGGIATLAGLAGIDIDAESSGQALAILESHEFTRSFIEDQNLLPILFSEKWDPRTQQWKGDRAHWPDVRDGVRLFDRKVRRLGEDKKKGVVVLTVTWRDPQTAANWANLLVSRLNARVRDQVMAESKRNIEFLRGELNSTNVVALQQSVSRLMESEMQKMMSARGDSEYALKVIDRAVPAKWKSSPKRLRILILGALSGLFSGFVLVSILALRDKKGMSRE